MRFAKTIKQIQGLQAYHSGDKLNVEVDIVMDEGTSLRDTHDLGESLQYVLESVPSGKFPGSLLPLLRILWPETLHNPRLSPFSVVVHLLIGYCVS